MKPDRHAENSESKATKPKGSGRVTGLLSPESARNAPDNNVSELRARLAEAEETLRAIRNGEVDTVLVAGELGRQVFTLEGAGDAYRDLIESMNEGALTLGTDQTILYANQCFARMLEFPLEQVTGSSLGRFLTVEDRAALSVVLKRKAKSGAKLLVMLQAREGSQIPVQISIRHVAKYGPRAATISAVVTDLTEARRNEELLRTLTHRVFQAQETERARVALELHDGIAQMLCAVQFWSQALVAGCSKRDDPTKSNAMKLQDLAGKAAEEVERISHDLRPRVLDQLGLLAALRLTSAEFDKRTKVSVNLASAGLTARLPAATELTLYRIFQEALQNVEKHARAQHVTINLTQAGGWAQLAIKDDGIGFDPDHQPARRKGKGGLGLLGMRERANYLGGTHQIKSSPRCGTEIVVRVPLMSRAR